MRRVTVSFVLLMASAAWAAGTPEQKCQGGKNAVAGKLAACLAKAEKKLVTGGDPMAYAAAVAKCSAKFQDNWQKLEQAAVDAGTSCPSTGDQAGVEADVDAFGACLADKLEGQKVGNCFREFPASGQTTSYGPGSDGDLQAGATMAFTDNSDGTITDNRTGLMWEKKDDSGGIHDKDTTYDWGMVSAPYTMNGTMVTMFLADLNSGAGFAGYTDWRIPSIKELQSIVDYDVPVPGPAVNAVFHQTATCGGCTNVASAACSCTAPGTYWSSTTLSGFPDGAWGVFFMLGGGTVDDKSTVAHIRAVRGGL